MGWPVTHPCTIYAIRCSVNGKVYIGRTYRFNQRIKEHFYELRQAKKRKTEKKGIRTSTHFQEDYNIYGESAFEVYILQENVPPDKVKETEAFWICEYKATNPDFGYNVFDEKIRPIESSIKQGIPPKPLR